MNYVSIKKLTLELKVIYIHCTTFLSCIHAVDLILVSILTFTMTWLSKTP